MFEIQNDNMNLAQIADSGQCFRWQALAENVYNVIMLDKSVVITQKGNKFSFSCDEEEYNNVWKHYLDIDTDYAKIIAEIDEKDVFLRKAAEYGKGIRILNQNFWEMLVSFVISQNNNIPRITKSLNALCEKFHGFPSGDMLCGLQKEDLAGLGLGYRDEYIIEAAKYYNLDNSESKFLELSYEDSMKELMTVKGIGKKVANCICLFGLHKLEACPIDTWIKKIIEEDYNGVMPKWMSSKWAGVYQQYVFYYKRSIKNK